MGGRLRGRVEGAAEAAVARQKYVAPLDVLVAIGWVTARVVEDWRQGRLKTLAERVGAPPERRAEMLEILRAWAGAQGLAAETSEYVAATRDRRELVFAVPDDPAYRVHWVRADLTEAQRARVTAKQNKVPDLMVLLGPGTCAECGESGDHFMADDLGTLCLTCVDLDHLVFLPAGDAALTRRAKKESTLSAVVAVWNKRRRRYERRGLLVEEAGLAAAEEQCFADEDLRMRRRERDRERRAGQDVEFQARMAAEIGRLFPRCPAGRAARIAEHTALRGSGRVGRSAAGRALDERAVTAAVVASVRHEDTDYDALLMAGVPRPVCRERIRPRVDQVLAAWRLS
ncbi:DUF2293 domain-containing protein [Actinocorallia longicatena]|uniref:DUF2293 domain-containing protein n=1 Tax=Actinocorallia longicatena TaxID=111803 RepID=A0ABP6Q786_9ACTN